MYEVLKNHVLQLLQKDDTARRLTLLEQELGVTMSARGAFHEALNELCAEGRVIVGPDHIVRLPSLSGEVTGTFRAHTRGFGFVSCQQHPGQELFIPEKGIGSAMNGDRVVAQVTRKGSKDAQGRLIAKIVNILERAHTTAIGMLRLDIGVNGFYNLMGKIFSSPSIWNTSTDARFVRERRPL